MNNILKPTPTYFEARKYTVSNNNGQWTYEYIQYIACIPLYYVAANQKNYAGRVYGRNEFR